MLTKFAAARHFSLYTRFQLDDKLASLFSFLGTSVRGKEQQISRTARVRERICSTDKEEISQKSAPSL